MPTMVFRLGLRAKNGWRKLRGFRQLANVINGIKFIDGIDQATPLDPSSSTPHLTITQPKNQSRLT